MFIDKLNHRPLSLPTSSSWWGFHFDVSPFVFGSQSVYHQVIEALRREADLGGSRSTADIRSELCSVVEEGLIFYEGLLERMQELHDFRLSQQISREPFAEGNAGDCGAARGGKHGSSSGTLKVVLDSLTIVFFFVFFFSCNEETFLRMIIIVYMFAHRSC